MTMEYWSLANEVMYKCGMILLTLAKKSCVHLYTISSRDPD